MELNEYMNLASTTAIYKNPKLQIDPLAYVALGLAGEAGEFANKVKKMFRDREWSKEALAEELGDVLWYLSQCCKELDLDFDTVASQNINKVQKRYRVTTTTG